MASFFKKYKIPIFIFLISFSLRVIINILLKGFSTPLFSDAAAYEELGRNLLHNKGFVLSNIGPTAYRMPLLPFFISILYRIFGEYEFVVRMFSSFLDSLTAILIYFLGKNIYTKKIGIFSGIIYAFSPFAIGECLQISSEVLFTLILLALITYLTFNWKTLNIIKLTVSGFLLTLATLTRPTSIYLFLFLAIAIFIVSRNKKQALINGLILTLSFSIFYSPWIIRNHIVFKKIIISSTVAGEVLLGAHNPDVFNNSRRSGTFYCGSNTKYFPATMNEYNRHKAMQKQAINNIKKYWYKMPLHELNKLKYFWNFFPNIAFEVDWKKGILGFIFFGIFLPFFIWGLKDIKRKDLIFIWVTILYFNLIALIIYGSIRMRFPINPYIYIISSNYMLLFISKYFSKLRMK